MRRLYNLRWEHGRRTPSKARGVFHTCLDRLFPAIVRFDMNKRNSEARRRKTPKHAENTCIAIAFMSSQTRRLRGNFWHEISRGRHVSSFSARTCRLRSLSHDVMSKMYSKTKANPFGKRRGMKDFCQPAAHNKLFPLFSVIFHTFLRSKPRASRMYAMLENRQVPQNQQYIAKRLS